MQRQRLTVLTKGRVNRENHPSLFMLTERAHEGKERGCEYGESAMRTPHHPSSPRTIPSLRTYFTAMSTHQSQEVS